MATLSPALSLKGEGALLVPALSLKGEGALAFKP
jgi:hypothetical protein